MRQFILLRHAKAAQPAAGQDDFSRTLTAQGRSDAPLIGKALADAGGDPEFALVSDAQRCRETWELVAPLFPNAQLKLMRSLYNASAEELFEAAEAAGAARVMVVAHNPGLHELAARLAHRNTPLDAKVRSKYPPAGGALFSRADESASWRLTAYVTPQDSNG